MTTPDPAHDSTNFPRIDSDWFCWNTIRIAKFDEVFIKADNEKLKRRNRPLLWISQPTGFTSRGYHALFDEFEGVKAMAVYGCFNCLVKLAGKPPNYGTLTHENGERMTLGYITREAFIPPGLICDTVRWGLKVGWLELDVDSSGCHPDAIRTVAGCHPDYKTGQDETTQHQTPQRKGRSPPGLVSDLPPFDDIERHWNAALSVSQSLTDTRRNKLKTRWKDPAFRTRWHEAIDRIAHSDFCRGLNDRGWRASLDWFLKPDSFTKILEGNYDNNHNAAGPARGNNAAIREQANAVAFAAVYGSEVSDENCPGTSTPLFDEENVGTHPASTRHLG